MPLSIFKLPPPHDQPFCCAVLFHLCNISVAFDPSLENASSSTHLEPYFSPYLCPSLQSNTQDACVADVHMYGFVLFLFFFFPPRNQLFIYCLREGKKHCLEKIKIKLFSTVWLEQICPKTKTEQQVVHTFHFHRATVKNVFIDF